MTLAYAPYGFYTDKTRVGLSVDKIEQAINKARLMSTTGFTFPGTSKNADIAVSLKKSAKVAEIYALASTTSDISDTARAALVESIRLEDNVVISQLGSDNALLIVFRAPSGKRELIGGTSTGGIIGHNGAITGSLSKHFDIQASYAQ